MKAINRISILILALAMAVSMLVPSSVFAETAGKDSSAKAAAVTAENEDELAELTTFEVFKKGYVRIKFNAASPDGRVTQIAYSVNGGNPVYFPPGVSGWVSVPYGQSTITAWGTDDENNPITEQVSQTVISKKMTKTKITCATLINDQTVSLHWKKACKAADGYFIYVNNKRMKTVAGLDKLRCKIKVKNAAKKKFKVVPYIDMSGKKYRGPASKAKKPGANSKKFKNSIKARDYSYDVSCRYIIKKVTLKGKKYYVEGYIVNTCKYLTALTCKAVSIKITCNGKIVAKKSFKNVKVNLEPGKSKKKNFTIKGKSGKDIRAEGGWITDYCEITY